VHTVSAVTGTIHRLRTLLVAATVLLLRLLHVEPFFANGRRFLLVRNMSAKRKGGSGGDDAAPAKKKASSKSSSSSSTKAAAAAPALPFVPPDFDPTRARVLTSRTQSLPAAGGACVVLWMSRDQRAEDNHAMLYARGVAAAHNVPVKVLFNLVPTFLEATLRQVTYGCVHVPLFHFLLQYYSPRPAVRLHDHRAARDGARPARQAHSVPSHDGGPGYVIVLQLISTHSYLSFTRFLDLHSHNALLPRVCCRAVENVPRFAKDHDALLVVCDFSPLRVGQLWHGQVADKLDTAAKPVPYVQVHVFSSNLFHSCMLMGDLPCRRFPGDTIGGCAQRRSVLASLAEA